MSHFLVLAILPKDTTMDRVESETALLLQSYDESIQVAPYETECGCIGVQAQMEVDAKVKESFDINQVRTDYQNLPHEEQSEKKWDELVAPCIELQKQLLADHPLINEPNPDCKSCQGSGKRMTQYSPDAKWDWWVIGGRWDGWIYGPERAKASSDGKHGFNFGEEHQQPNNNCRRVSEIPIDDPYYLPFAIVTPTSEWIEQGQMGWWAIVKNGMDEDEWHQTVKTVLSKYSDHLAVAVDCHV